MKIMLLVDGYQDLIRLRDAQIERLEVNCDFVVLCYVMLYCDVLCCVVLCCVVLCCVVLCCVVLCCYSAKLCHIMLRHDMIFYAVL